MKHIDTSASRIPLSKPDLGIEEHEALRMPIERGWVTQGPEVEAFESEFAAWTGAPYARAVSNCTAALFLALKVAGVRAGDEVITVSHSFIATSNSVRQLDALPVFVDIDPVTFNINPERIAAAVTPRTRAVLCVHQIGLPCDLEKVLAVAARYGLPVIEDAACAIGSEVRVGGEWARIGRPHGDLACFSFHPRKVLTTGDGGMITAKRAEHARQIELLRNHGADRSPLARHQSADLSPERYAVMGYNFRLTDLQAAVGRVQLRRLPQMLDIRRRLAGRYEILLSGIPGLVVPQVPPYARHNWQSYCVRLPAATDTARLTVAMASAGVTIKSGVMCSHREPAYQDLSSFRVSGSLLHSEEAQDRCVLLPLYSQMTEEDQDRVVRTFRSALTESLEKTA